jgi:hypothetical protein
MKLPKLQQPEKYVGLYVVDFGDHAGVGFTAEEVAELFESEKYKDCKAYKIYKAYPDGRLEQRGVRAELFQLEIGMFFYSSDEQTARGDFERLIALAVRRAPACRAKVHLVKYSEEKFAAIIIYPAEYNDEISEWLLAGEYKTGGAAEGGFEAVQRYYSDRPEILDKHQLFGRSETVSRTGEELLASLKVAVQR